MSEESTEFEDWHDFTSKLIAETPFDLQLFVVDEGNHLDWDDQGLGEALYDKESLDATEFKDFIRSFVIEALKELNEEFEYELKIDYKTNIDLFVDYAVVLHKRYLVERSNARFG